MGFIVAFCAACLASARDLTSKKLSFNIDGTLNTFGSFTFALPFYIAALVVAYIFGFDIFVLSWGVISVLLLRSISDAFAEWTRMQAFTHGEISLVVPFLALSPLFLIITSPLITGDQLTTHGVVGLIAAAGGGLLLFRGHRRSGDKAQTKGIVFAVVSSFFFSLNHCFDRLAALSTSPLVAAFGMTLFSALLIFPLAARKERPTKQLWGVRYPLLVRGALETAFMFCKLSALHYMQAPYVVSITASAMIFSIVGGRIFFGDSNLRQRLIAGACVLVGIVVVLLGELSF